MRVGACRRPDRFGQAGCFSRVVRLPATLEFFSLGGLLAVVWKPRVVPLPWVLAASMLVVLGCWDLVRAPGRVDFILLGLAGYELALGLTEDAVSRSS